MVGFVFLFVPLAMEIANCDALLTGLDQQQHHHPFGRFTAAWRDNRVLGSLSSAEKVMHEISAMNESSPSGESLSNMEKAWRHAKKPLLRVGSKGVTLTHGNSLRELLAAHTAVKVKINTEKLGTLPDAFERLKELAVESGAPRGIELLRFRDSDKTILFGQPGTRERIENGEFPPQVLPRKPKIKAKQ